MEVSYRNLSMGNMRGNIALSTIQTAQFSLQGISHNQAIMGVTSPFYLFLWALCYARVRQNCAQVIFKEGILQATTPCDQDHHVFDSPLLGQDDQARATVTDQYGGRLTERKNLGMRRLTLNVKDCGSPTSVADYLYSQVCSSPTNNTEFKDKKTKHVTIMQYVPERMRRAVRCTVFESHMYEYCGAYSHMKLMESPQIMQPTIMDPAMCAQVKNEGSYRDESGQEHTVRLDADEDLYLRFMRRGGLSLSPDNVQCQGEMANVGGSLHREVLEFVSLKIEFRWVDVVQRPSGRVEDLDNSREIPGNCATDDSCRSGYTAYAFSSDQRFCPHLKRIKRASVFYDKLMIGSELRDVVFSHDDHILLPLGKAVPLPTICQGFAKKMYETAFDEIKIILDEDWNISPDHQLLNVLDVDAADVHVLLSERVEGTYLLFRTKEMLNHQRQTMGEKLCSLSREAWADSDFSQFHPNTILRRRGEIISEIGCKPAIADVFIGEDIMEGQCYRDFLPARLGSKLKLVAANSRVLIEPGMALTSVCEDTMSPIFRTNEGVFITADPVVRAVDLTIHHQLSPLVEELVGQQHLHFDETDVFSSDMLYTASEEHKFDSFLSYHSIKKAVDIEVTAQMCSSGHCGTYAPTGSTFDLERLNPDSISPSSWLMGIFWQGLDVITNIGSVCSVIIVAGWLYARFMACADCLRWTRRGHSASAARLYAREPWLIPRWLPDGRANPHHPGFANQRSRRELETDRGVLDRVFGRRAAETDGQDVELRNMEIVHVYTKDGKKLPLRKDEYQVLVDDADTLRSSRGVPSLPVADDVDDEPEQDDGEPPIDVD